MDHDTVQWSRAAEQPAITDIKIVDGIFVKQIAVRAAGMIIPQHSHSWDHLSMIAAGAVRVWADGEPLGDFRAPAGIAIKAGVKHTFLTIEPGTIIYCIHNISHTGEIDVVEEHQLPGVG